MALHTVPSPNLTILHKVNKDQMFNFIHGGFNTLTHNRTNTLHNTYNNYKCYHGNTNCKVGINSYLYEIYVMFIQTAINALVVKSVLIFQII